MTPQRQRPWSSMWNWAAGCCAGACQGGSRHGAESPRTSHAATCVTGVARGERGAPHGGWRAGGALRAAAAVAVAAADHVPRDPRAGAAVRCGHGGGPWPPGCSWSGCRAPGSAGASDSWGTPSADATESLRGTQNGREK